MIHAFMLFKAYCFLFIYLFIIFNRLLNIYLSHISYLQLNKYIINRFLTENVEKIRNIIQTTV